MKTELPICESPIVTYQESSFLTSVILAHPNTKNYLYNTYINLECNNTNNPQDIILNFSNITNDDMVYQGIASKGFYSFNNIPNSQLTDIFRNYIENNQYLMFFNIDEYYLPYSDYFNIEHHLHDAYIYGYDNDYFLVTAYSHKKLCHNIVHSDDIINALSSETLNVDLKFFNTFFINQSIHVDLELYKIYHELYNYFYSFGSSYTKVYGLNTYKLIQNILITIQNSADEFYIDLRSFRIIWEHKKVMYLRIQQINNLIPIDQYIFDLINKLIDLSSTLFLLLFKCNIKKSKKNLDRVINYLNQIKEMDTSIVKYLLDLLEKYR